MYMKQQELKRTIYLKNNNLPNEPQELPSSLDEGETGLPPLHKCRWETHSLE
jgi:hypothetical protein